MAYSTQLLTINHIRGHPLAVTRFGLTGYRVKTPCGKRYIRITLFRTVYKFS